MQHLEVNCAVRRFFKSLGFEGLSDGTSMTSQCVQQLRVFVWWRYAACLSSCLQTACNSAMCELKCKTGIKIPTDCWHLSYKESWCLVPFSSNIACFRSQSASVLAWIKDNSVTYQFTIARGSAGYAARKFCHKTRLHWTFLGNDWQSEWGFVPRNVYVSTNCW